MRLSVGRSEVRAGFRWDSLNVEVGSSPMVEALDGWLSRAQAVSVRAEKRSFCPRESASGGGEEGRFPGRTLPRRARRLVRVGGLSSLSSIPPESSIATRDFRASGGGGRRPREADSAQR